MEKNQTTFRGKTIFEQEEISSILEAKKLSVVISCCVPQTVFLRLENMKSFLAHIALGMYLLS